MSNTRFPDFMPADNGSRMAQRSIDRKTMIYATKDGVPLQLDKYVDNSVAYRVSVP